MLDNLLEIAALKHGTKLQELKHLESGWREKVT